MNENIRKAELQNCSAIKMILMFIVILYHCCCFWTGGWFIEKPVYEDKLLGFVAKWMNSFHIYGFFLISGYIFFYTVSEEKKYRSFSAFFLKKVKRLLVPYAFTAIIWVIPFATYFYRLSATDILYKYVLAISPNQLWFLIVLFWISIIFYQVNDYIKDHTVFITIFMILLYMFGVYSESTWNNYLQIFTTFRCVIFFYYGYLIRKNGSATLFAIPSSIYVIANILLLVTLCYLEKTSFLLSGSLTQGVEFLLRTEGAIGSFVTLQRVVGKINLNHKIVKHMIKISMPAYLFHQQAIYISIILFNGKFCPEIHVIINLLVAFSVSVIISDILLSNKITCFLIGEKSIKKKMDE